MANLYDSGREGFLDGSIDWDTDVIKAVLIDTTSYTVNLATDKFLSNIAVGARVQSSSAFTSVTKAAGVAGAADLVFSTVPVGPAIGAFAVYQDTGVATTSRLISYDATATGLPVTPNGTNINVTWDAGVNKIFKL